MASADLRDELTCCICLNIYTDPVTLICGHSFCQDCISSTWEIPEEKGYFCPECRHRSRYKSNLCRNLRLCNIIERFRSMYLEQNEAGIFCTYCDSPVPAAKVCLHCDVSLCDKHLMKHNRAVEHVLLEPTTSWENRKCSVHKKALEYYCCEAGICVYCSAGEHREHAVETLNEASEKRKHNLRNILEELTSKKEELEESIQSLQGQSREQQEIFDVFKKQVTDMIENIRNKLGALEKELGWVHTTA